MFNLNNIMNKSMLNNEELHEAAIDCMSKIIYMESIGINFCDVSEGIKDDMSIVKFTVPECSEITENELSEDYDISTSEGLIKIAKDTLIEIFLDMYRAIAKADGDSEEFINWALDDIDTSECYKFYTKVRTGEKWTKDDQKRRIEELINEIDTANAEAEKWKEV